MTVTDTAAATASPGTSTVTVASLARDWAERAPGQVAMREKQFGIWRERTWHDVWTEVDEAANALLALGVEVGDRVSIHAEDRPEWIILDLATVAVRGITVGLYPTNPTAEVEYTLADSGTVIHLAEDEEQVDKVLEIDRTRVPAVRTVIFVEPRGLVGATDDRLMLWDNFLELGRTYKQQHPDAVAQRMAAAQPDDVMTLVYTSGTTGPPKGAMLTNANAAFCIDIVVNSEDRVPGGPPTHKDLIVTYLPLCHVAERIFSTWTHVSTGAVLNFAESIEVVNANLREVQPTIFFAVPRIWEKLHAAALIKSSDASRFKRAVLGVGLALGRRIGRIKVAHGGNHTLESRILYAIGWVIVFRAMRERLGLRRCRYAGSGAAPIAPEVLEFFIGLGVPVYELYGMTENSAIATANFVGRMKLGTVGEPHPGIGFRIDEETGEIQTRHAGVFAGYWGKPDKTAETMTDDGWLRTGDVGEWVDGTHVRIVDRIKDIIITAGGKNISPSEIENSLKTSPYIREAMVIGDGRPFLSALIGIEFDTVGNWALRRGIPYTTYRDLSEKEEVVELIEGAVRETNEKFARVENVRKFRLIPKELDHEDGELTATQKLKRSSMMKMFSELVDSMYR
ncbi:MAG: long-chain fatty acid--CoA ligase [Ilumatobacter sp.]|nr:MAG: long-chain fatty acid--CoA ligase [Ilumatobacter sp.]